MTNHSEHEDDFDEEDPRVQLLESLADGLAALSEASDTPNGVSPVSSMFSSVDVDFASDAWTNQLAEIQGWLYLSDDLPLTGGEPFLQALITELELDPTDLLAPGTASPPLTIRALERLNERVDTACRLQADFLEELETKGTSRATATQSWADAWAEIDGEIRLPRRGGLRRAGPLDHLAVGVGGRGHRHQPLCGRLGCRCRRAPVRQPRWSRPCAAVSGAVGRRRGGRARSDRALS